MAHFCFHLLIFSLVPSSSASSLRYFFFCLQNHATFHPFIHFSHDSLVSVEMDCQRESVRECQRVCLCACVSVSVCACTDLLRGSLLPEMTHNFFFLNGRPVPHFKWDGRQHSLSPLRLSWQPAPQNQFTLKKTLSISLSHTHTLQSFLFYVPSSKSYLLLSPAPVC